MANKRAPAGAKAVVAALEERIAKSSITKVAKASKVTVGYLKKIVSAADRGKLGNVWTSKKAVVSWQQRLAGQGKKAGPRSAAAREAQLARFRPEAMPSFAEPVKPPSEFVLRMQSGKQILVSPAGPPPIGVDHILNPTKRQHSWPTLREAANWLTNIGALHTIAVMFRLSTGSWGFAVLTDYTDLEDPDVPEYSILDSFVDQYDAPGTAALRPPEAA